MSPRVEGLRETAEVEDPISYFSIDLFSPEEFDLKSFDGLTKTVDYDGVVQSNLKFIVVNDRVFLFSSREKHSASLIEIAKAEQLTEYKVQCAGSIQVLFMGEDGDEGNFRGLSSYSSSLQRDRVLSKADSDIYKFQVLA